MDEALRYLRSPAESTVFCYATGGSMVECRSFVLRLPAALPRVPSRRFDTRLDCRARRERSRCRLPRTDDGERRPLATFRVPLADGAVRFTARDWSSRQRRHCPRNAERTLPRKWKVRPEAEPSTVLA